VRRLIRKLGRRLFYGWKKWRPHEEAILEAIRASMPEDDQRVLAAQLKALEFVQRHGPGRILLMSLDPDEDALPLFANRDPEHCLARVRLQVDKRRHIVLLMTCLGRLSTLEFKHSPEPLINRTYKILDISFNADEKGIASAITRLEHGRFDEEEG
jgi:hypothetical protein